MFRYIDYYIEFNTPVQNSKESVNACTKSRCENQNKIHENVEIE